MNEYKFHGNKQIFILKMKQYASKINNTSSGF